MELLLRVLMNMIPTYVAGPSASTQIVVLPGMVLDLEKPVLSQISLMPH